MYPMDLRPKNLNRLKREIQLQRDDAVERRNKLARHVDHRAYPLPPDFAEQAQELGNDETMVALSGALDTLIEELDRALQRTGSYGTCATCGEPISESRLEALHAATLCLVCAT
jgi:RNA polymerase-binding transcription factor DksA